MLHKIKCCLSKDLEDLFDHFCLINLGSHLGEIPSRVFSLDPSFESRAWAAPLVPAPLQRPSVLSFQDAFEQGQVFLGSKEQGYEVQEDLPKGIRGNRWKAGLTVITPERRFVLTCPTEKEQHEWFESFRDVLSRPLTPLNLLSKMCVHGRGGCDVPVWASSQ